MNSGRLFRAAVMCLTLFGCMWALTRLQGQKRPVEAAPADSTRLAAPKAAQPAAETPPAPPVDISQLPLVALDNTCFYEGTRDLSRCTGTISDSPAREYMIHANGMDTYYVIVEPRSVFYDPSLVVLDSRQQCVIGEDERGPGYSESTVLERPACGDYSLIVGGYSDDCGPYELTISTSAPEIARVIKPAAFIGRNGTVLRWETFAEVDLAHFELYRQSGNSRERIAVLRAHGSKAGFANYRFIDRAPQGDSNYVIEAVARDGRREVVLIKDA